MPGEIMRRLSRAISSALLLLFATAFSSTMLRADVTGSISGVVRDRAQAVVTGAKVQIPNVQTNASQETTRGADGSYHFLALPPGNYKITAPASGFRPYDITDITLQVNDQLRLNMTLQVGTIVE